MSEHCFICEKSNGRLRKCSGCKAISYCSKLCQLVDWPRHKHECCRLPNEGTKPNRDEATEECSNCKSRGRDLKRCLGCKTAFYCSKSCQKQNWWRHKSTCKHKHKESPERTEQLQVCSNCKKSDSHFPRCSGCKIVYYCSKSCQRQQWPIHKWFCQIKRLIQDSDVPIDGGKANGSFPRGHERIGQFPQGYLPQFAIVRDNRTGKIFAEEQTPTEEFQLPPAPYPRPMELTELVLKLESFLPHPRFFHLPDGDSFSFITDLRSVKPEIFSSAVSDEDILVAKIVSMDVYWTRHGICIMGDERQIPVIVHFYIDGGIPYPYFKWRDAVPGNYICIQAPVIHCFLDGQVGFRVNEACHVRIVSPSGHVIWGV